MIARCLDPRDSTRAVSYLKALGKDASIPVQTNTPEHSALVRLSDWLADEQAFFGRHPDSISLFDSRTLNWVPEGIQRQIWLIRFACDRSEDNYRGYDGFGAVWADTLSIVMTEDETLASIYAELLGNDPNFPVDEKAVDLLRTLNPQTFDEA